MNTPTKRIPNTIMHNGKRKVCRIFDAGSEVCDRYTIAFKGFRPPAWHWHGMVYPYLACSVNPYHECGGSNEASEFLTGKGLGKRVSFESLNADVQSFILANI